MHICTYESKYITTAGPLAREKRTNIHYLPTLKRLVLALDDCCELQPLSSLGSETDASQVTRGFGKKLAKIFQVCMLATDYGYSIK